MRAFISYVNDDDKSTQFATWLHQKLKRPGSPLEPWFDIVDLPAVGVFENRLPTAVSLNDVFLFVRTEYSPDSNVCMDELRYAKEYGLIIFVLRVERPRKRNLLVDHLPPVDFTSDHEEGLRELFMKIATLNKPEGQIAQLQEKLRAKRNGLRRLDPLKREEAHGEIAVLENQLKGMLAKARETTHVATAAPDAVRPTPAGADVGGHGLTAAVLGKITGDDTPVILIVGPEGIGKTRLATDLLRRIGTDGRQPKVITKYLQAHGPQSFTANHLAELLKEAMGESELAPDARLERLDVDVVRKLEILMDLFRDRRVMVVLDSGEALLDEETGRLLNSELDDALEILARQPRTVVQLLLVTRERPFVRHRRWLARSLLVGMDTGLSLREFGQLLASLDPDDDHGLLDPPEELLAALHEYTDGRPRAAEVVHGILTSPHIADSEHQPLKNLAAVVESLAGVTTDEALGFLTGRLIDGLTSDERRTLRALSAFGVPVDAHAVAFMLPDEDVSKIDRTLRNLRSRHLVRRTSDQLYYVQRPDDVRALQAVRPPADDDTDTRDSRSLILRAASYFALRRQTTVRGLGDLAAEFAEIDLLIRAEEFEAALRAIEAVDEYLENWGCRWMLRRQREQLRGLLRDDMYEFVNLHALGDIAMRQDDLAVAESSYRQGLSYLENGNRIDYRKKLYVALGTVMQRRDEMAKAEEFYRRALAMARGHGQEEAEIVPQAGLAECHRHWGDVASAVTCLKQALTLTRAELREHPGMASRRRLAEILWKLGVRYADMGKFGKAEALLKEAGTHASDIDSWVTRCQLLAASATVALWQGRIAQAKKVGREALELALDLGQAPLRRQVYTTLATCSLLEDDITSADAEIRMAAARDRLPGHALTTLALRGVLEYRQDHRWPAQRLFRQLRLEAEDRTRRDSRDFGAFDMEGFARCGEHLGQAAPPLDAAVAAFRRARDVTRARGLTTQIVQLLSLFGNERLAPAITAAAGE